MLRSVKAGRLGKIVGRLSAGDFFGERALIKNDKRAASCVAASSVDCVTLHRDVFTDVLSGVTSLLGDYAKIYDDGVCLSAVGMAVVLWCCGCGCGCLAWQLVAGSRCSML